MANKKSLKDPAKSVKIADMIALLRGVVEGRKKLHIFVNVQEGEVGKTVKGTACSLKGPLSVRFLRKAGMASTP